MVSPAAPFDFHSTLEYVILSAAKNLKSFSPTNHASTKPTDTPQSVIPAKAGIQKSLAKPTDTPQLVIPAKAGIQKTPAIPFVVSLSNHPNSSFRRKPESTSPPFHVILALPMSF